MYEIQKGNPLPKPLPPSGRFPFNKMEVGDSIDILVSSGEVSYARVCMSNFQTSTGRRFRSQKMIPEDGGEPFVRFWRLA